MSKPRVVVAGDRALLDTCDRLLAEACDVVGLATDAKALATAVQEQRPDVVVLDLSILNALDTARRIKQHDPSVRLVFMTANEDPELAAQAFRAGGSAYLLKRSAGAELSGAIREVLQHGSYVTPLVTEGMLDSMAPVQSAPAAPQITSRQREVLHLLAQGKSMKDVAAALSVTARTVAFHKYRMMEQLGIRTNAELIQYAIRHQIV